jgi:hypothetical protein
MQGQAMARPSLYSPELAEAICARLEAGEPLARICRDNGMPGVRTVLQWADEKEDFQAEYSRAHRAQAEQLVARIHDIMETAVDKDSAAAARVQINGLIWIASKQAPKRYGDRLDLNVDHTFDLAAELTKRRQQVLDGRPIDNPPLLPNGAPDAT